MRSRSLPRTDQPPGLERLVQRRGGASPYASYACVDTWLTDFRDDLPRIDIPTLVVHGTEDRSPPYESTAKRLPGLPGLIKDLTLSPSRAARTTSAGLTPMRSTPPCWTSSPANWTAERTSLDFEAS